MRIAGKSRFARAAVAAVVGATALCLHGTNSSAARTVRPYVSVRQVEYSFSDGDTHLWHTIRNPSGTWQPKGDLRAMLSLGSAGSVVSAQDTSGAVQYLLEGTGGIWFTIRYPDGHWRPKVNIAPTVSFASGWPLAAAATPDGAVQFIVRNGADQLWLLIRDYLGRWHRTRNITSMWPVLQQPYVYAAAAAPDRDGAVQYVFATGGKLFHTILYKDGTWQPLGDVGATLGIDFSADAEEVIPAAAADGTGAVQYVFATCPFLCLNGGEPGGKVWHTIRYANGTWQPKRDLGTKLGLPWQQCAISPAAVPDARGEVQFVFAAFNLYQNRSCGVWHTIRYPDGTWQPKHDVNVQLHLVGVIKDVSAATSGVPLLP